MIKKTSSQDRRNSHIYVTLITIGIFSFILSVVTIPARAMEAPRGEELQAIQDQMEALKKNQNTILEELTAIKNLLNNQKAAAQGIPVNLEISIEGEPFKGSPTAPVTLIEFSDFECPYCGRHARNTLLKLDKEYIETGKVKYVFKDFPIPTIHKKAVMAATAANCAGEQEQYWPMHQKLFSSQKSLAEKELIDHAKKLNLKMEQFQSCLGSEKGRREIEEDMKEGRKAGVRGTPTLFLGRTDQNSSTVKIQMVIRGAGPLSKFQNAIETMLKTPSP